MEHLLKAGYAPFNPMLSMLCPFNVPTNLCHGEWLEMDCSWVGVSDAVLRLPGESIGGDMETDHAKSLGIPVYTDIELLLKEVPCESI